MRSRQIFQALVFGFVLALTGCGDDQPSGTGGTTGTGGGNGNGIDPNAVCSGGLCDSVADVKQDCIDDLNDCLNNNPDLNDDECVAAARLFCTSI